MEAMFVEETVPAHQDLTFLFQQTHEMIARWKASGKKTKQGQRALTFLFPAKQ